MRDPGNKRKRIAGQTAILFLWDFPAVKFLYAVRLYRLIIYSQIYDQALMNMDLMNALTSDEVRGGAHAFRR